MDNESVEIRRPDEFECVWASLFLESNKIVVNRPEPTTTQFDLSSKVDVFFLARGNERVTGILDGITVEFTPSHLDPSDKTTISYSIQAARNIIGTSAPTAGIPVGEFFWTTSNFMVLQQC